MLQGSGYAMISPIIIDWASALVIGLVGIFVIALIQEAILLWRQS